MRTPVLDLSKAEICVCPACLKIHPNAVMKIPVTRRQSGFTLVELLVVIAIIAVLAGAGFAAGNAAIQKAKRVTALSSATAVESAVNNFFTEYGTMPKDDLSADVEIDTKTDTKFLHELLGISTPTLNTRLVKFLSVKEGKNNKGGIIYNTGGTAVSGLYDPWGGPFYVMLDGDYDEKIKVQVKSAGAQAKEMNGRRVACWSLGADAAKGGTSGKMGDDVITW
jgi:prepilin-type N-terminal cleavage/methylation domain-containing protein